jgi:hypothetical protein
MGVSAFSATRVYLSEQFPAALRGRGHLFDGRESDDCPPCPHPGRKLTTAGRREIMSENAQPDSTSRDR